MTRYMRTLLTAKLMTVGVNAVEIRYIPNEGKEEGGVIVRVGRIQDIEPAEQVAAKIQSDLGITILVAF